jgi:hypothetical protein
MSHATTHPPGPWRARPLRSSQALVLALAVLVHAALLLIPLRQAEPPARRAPLQIEFWADRPNLPAETGPEPATGPPTPDRPRRPETVAQVPPPAVVTTAPPASDRHDDFVITAAYLYDAVSRMEWSDPQKPPSLGIARPRELPHNLAGPVLPVIPTWFDGLAAPGAVEVLDRWQGPDGGMMVVMRTPTGHTLCGRGDAWDPLNPLVEQVILFHTCGGGGRRARPAP